MTDTTVIAEQKGAVRLITLNRPERLNAINVALITGLRDALAEANAEGDVGAIVLRGAGKAFCSGDDLSDKTAMPANREEGMEIIEALQDVSRQILYGEKVVIGAVHGWAVGGGFEWVVNCDFSVWAEDAKAFCPEMRWGMSPTGGVTSLLGRIVGLHRARAILMLGDKLTADDLRDIGIAWRVVPEEQVLAEAMTLAERITELPTRAVRDLKRGLNAVFREELDLAIRLETESTALSIADPDTFERIQTFSGS
ncbi:enoyl-CoA hydratase/isomerase family protein [Lentisalinibacter sediminis]|uniref:enoyl-CoA hydratase/isomerase family protein n=1 Tax=Lentisalinibacter sediminis TaxID=2992237 RepID=UPI00386EE90A